MNVVFAASECVPFVKTGGLADVVGALPAAVLQGFKSRGGGKKRAGPKPRALTVLPKYAAIPKGVALERLCGRLRIPLGDRVQEGRVWTARGGQAGGEFYFIEHDGYFGRSGLYGSAAGDYEDNDERFAFYARAVLELCKLIDFRPDIVHAHDWQAGLLPAYLRTLYANDAFFQPTASVFTIHNIAYQGIFPKQSLFLTGLGWQNFTPQKLEYYDQVCFLKAGLVFAEKISTVSPHYAEEVRADPRFGKGMEGVLQQRAEDFVGILNGLDPSLWDPARDGHIARRFSPKAKGFLDRKLECKRDLQGHAGLPAVPEAPLVGMVSRLDPQKGFEHVLRVLPPLLLENPQAQWVILGTGDKSIQASLMQLARRHPRQVSMNLGFNEALAHKIYAGSDLFLMPSEFEPCGLGQMIAMRYGSIPVVTPTGGLVDTVRDWRPEAAEGTGFVAAEGSAPALREALLRAFAAHADRAQWRALARNALESDFSWGQSARRYIELFERALEKKAADEAQ